MQFRRISTFLIAAALLCAGSAFAAEQSDLVVVAVPSSFSSLQQLAAAMHPAAVNAKANSQMKEIEMVRQDIVVVRLDADGNRVVACVHGDAAAQEFIQRAEQQQQTPNENEQ